MDFPVAPVIRRSLMAAISGGALSYPAPAARFRKALAARMAARLGWRIAEECIEPLTDVMQGVSACISTHSAPATPVVCLTPAYPPFFRAVQELDRRAILVPMLQSETRYDLDFDELERAFRSGGRILLWCNPHNPTGRVFTRTELEAVARLVVQYDVTVVADEVHSDIVYDGRRHIPLASIDSGVAERTLTLVSASKSFNLSGMKCAAIIYGAERQRAAFSALPRALRGAPGVLGLVATTSAWEAGDPWLSAALRVLERNRDHLVRRLRSSLPGIRVLSPEGTYVAWLATHDDEAGAAGGLQKFFLERARVDLYDGAEFGGTSNHVRLTFACPMPLLDAIVDRMSEAWHSSRRAPS